MKPILFGLQNGNLLVCIFIVFALGRIFFSVACCILCFLPGPQRHCSLEHRLKWITYSVVYAVIVARIKGYGSMKERRMKLLKVGAQASVRENSTN